MSKSNKRTYRMGLSVTRAMFWRIREDAKDLNMSMSAYMYWQLQARLSNTAGMSHEALLADIAGSIEDWQTEEFVKAVEKAADSGDASDL